MGCDGGTIPRRDELVRTKKKPEQKDKNAETVAKWKHCAISQEPLRKPIVACELGRLYNKEAVLEHILSKEKAASNASHIAKLSDVKELNLTEKAGFEQKKDHKGDEYVDFNDSRYICPVTGCDMNGRQRFYLVWKCGCVLSERAIKEVKSSTCHKCGSPLNENDVIILNGSDEEIEELLGKMTERRRLAKLEKKKKRSATTSESPAEKKVKVDTNQPSTSKNATEVLNGHSSSKTDSKLVNGSEKSGGVKAFTKNVSLPEKAQNKYSIAKDPNASAAYKSLFTSHASAKRQEKAHWITHNPLYY